MLLFRIDVCGDAKLAEDGKDVNTRIELGDIFTVTKVNGNWLWVNRGWIHNSDVVLVDQAIAYFTEQVRRDPSRPTYHNRGWAYKQIGDLDKAIADEGESIRRTDPTDSKNLSIAYDNRGVMWNEKGEHDIAIIRTPMRAVQLDPKFSQTIRQSRNCLASKG